MGHSIPWRVWSTRAPFGVAILLLGACEGSRDPLQPQARDATPLFQHTAATAAVTLAGSFQSELGCPADWQPECAVTHLVYDAADDVWQATFDLPAGSWEYKAPLNDSWSENYGRFAESDGPNIPLVLASPSAVKFYYSHQTHWVTSSRNAVIATVAGSFQSELGCPGDWQADCLRSWLQDPEEDGVYTFTTSSLPAGSYEAKVAINESWDENYGQGGVQNGANIPFSVTAFGAPVTFTYDATTHVLTITAGTVNHAPVTYFAPRTITREDGGPQVVEFAIQDHDHSLFMDPFVLHVRAEGDRLIVGIVKVDGIVVLERRDVVALGRLAGPLTREVAIGPASVVTVELQGPPGGSLTFWIEAPLQPPPVITITSPARHTAGSGAMLEQGSLAMSTVDITGTACHPRYPITQLEIAGVPVPVAGNTLCVPFTVTQQSRWGMSVITGRARTARGREGTVVQAYTRSPEHYAVPVAGDLTTSVLGLFSHLTQAALDDGSRTDLDDLASLLQHLIAQHPLAIPAATAYLCNDVFEVRIPQQQPQISFVINSLTAHATHLAVDVTILNPSFAVTVLADANPFDGDCDGVLVENGTFSASSIRITANLHVVSAPAGQPPGITVTLSQPTTTVTGASATSTSAAAAEILNGLTSLAADLLSGYFGPDVLRALGPAMSGLLNALVPAYSGDFPLNAATVRVEGGFSSVTNGNGFLRMGLYGLVSPVTQLPGAIAPRGPVRALCGSAATPCPGDQAPLPPFNPGAYTSAVAVHQDLLNQTLWSAWRAGAFVLTEPDLSLNPTMPPVSMASADGDPIGEIQWGDVRVTATFDPADFGEPAGAPIVVESWVSATLRGTVQFDNASRVLGLSDVTSTFDVELIGTALPFDDAVVRAAIADRLRTRLEALTRDVLAVVPLPQGNPRLVNASIARSGFFYVLTGLLQ